MKFEQIVYSSAVWRVSSIEKTEEILGIQNDPRHLLTAYYLKTIVPLLSKLLFLEFWYERETANIAILQSVCIILTRYRWWIMGILIPPALFMSFNSDFLYQENHSAYHINMMWTNSEKISVKIKYHNIRQWQRRKHVALRHVSMVVWKWRRKSHTH